MVVVLFAIDGRDDIDLDEYRRTSARMRELVAQVAGFISYNTYEGEEGDGLAVVRFQSSAALDEWRRNLEHQQAQEKGRTHFYRSYWVQVCDSVREYRFSADRGYQADLVAMFTSSSAIAPREPSLGK